MNQVFSLETWQVVSLLITLIGAFFALARMLLAATTRTIDDKFKALGEHLSKQDAAAVRNDESLRRLERDLMDMRAELPRDYVRREDYTQAIATIMTKIDAMALRFEQVLRDALSNAKGGGQ
ncbi:MAG: hypothetical protein J0M20_10995 [Burkholderiales bacterium]|nr:hypothetical protein [Burkholderiales bacterium]